MYDCACFGEVDVAVFELLAVGEANEAATAKGSSLSLGAESLFGSRGFLVFRSDAGVEFRGFPPNGRLL